jgi:tetratricopeptide (TPR) repeat protein
LGAILGKSGHVQEAIESFQAALRLEPTLADAYRNLALALAQTGHAQKAIATAQQGIEVARSTGQMEAAKMTEQWLKQYQGELQGGRDEGAAPPAFPTSAKTATQ